MAGFNVSADFTKGKGNYCLVNTTIVENPNDLPTHLSENILYEVIRVKDSKPRFLNEHLTRLQNTLRTTNNTLVLPTLELTRDISALIQKNQIDNQNIKILISSDGASRYAYPVESFYPPQNYYEAGVNVKVIPYVRHSPHAKVVNVNLSEMRASALSLGIYELLLMNPSTGEVTEGSRTNVFCIVDNVVLTPPVGDVLPGITRGRVLEVIEELGLPVKEIALTKRVFKDATAVFITSTSNGIMPVKTVLFEDDNEDSKDTYDMDDKLLLVLMRKFSEK